MDVPPSNGIYSDLDTYDRGVMVDMEVIRIYDIFLFRVAASLHRLLERQSPSRSQAYTGGFTTAHVYLDLSFSKTPIYLSVSEVHHSESISTLKSSACQNNNFASVAL